MKCNTFTVAILLLAIFISSATAHTWVEDILHIAQNGTLIGPAGYARGTISRDSVPGPDQVMVWKTLNETLTADRSICSTVQQKGTQTPDFPVFEGSQGEVMALQYLENGHVSLLQASRPLHGGTIYIYGTSTPSNDDKLLSIHRVWNAAGTGGDKRGKLLATRPFDDQQCYEADNGGAISKARALEFPTISGASLKCQTDFQIPDDAPADYTFYWVWDWPQLNLDGTIINNEIYTQCLDVKVSGKTKLLAKDIKVEKPAFYDSIAIAEQITEAFLVDP
ncbi:hypothetical protein BJ878DRAFT_414168, partial [Calycina marina]